MNISVPNLILMPFFMTRSIQADVCTRKLSAFEPLYEGFG